MVLFPFLSEKYVIEGSKYAHWIGLYLSFQLNWVLGPFVYGRLQNLQTSEVTFAHDITSLIRKLPSYSIHWLLEFSHCSCCKTAKNSKNCCSLCYNAVCSIEAKDIVYLGLRDVDPGEQ